MRGPDAASPRAGPPRLYTTFSWKEANLRICSSRASVIIEEVKRLRAQLEEYAARHAEFLTSMAPIPLLPRAPQIAVRMAEASAICGVGPMAAVAGAVAQMAAETAIAAGAEEAIVENGGDVFLASNREVIVGLFAGDHPLSGRLAFRIGPRLMPISVCSSSSRFGHSMSFGDCDLAAVVASDGALADAAATLAGNSVRSVGEVDAALEKTSGIKGIRGVLIIKEGRVGMAGDLPPLVECRDPRFEGKTFHTLPESRP
jgi:ApbE superfamily uncharacterized protein (UPF0280 family)